MRSNERLTELTPARKRLVKLMLDLNFGQIEGLCVIDGEPVFDPAPRVVREVVFGKENYSHSANGLADFNLKKQITRMFAEIERLNKGVISLIVVRDGLPVRMKIEKKQ